MVIRWGTGSGEWRRLLWTGRASFRCTNHSSDAVLCVSHLASPGLSWVSPHYLKASVACKYLLTVFSFPGLPVVQRPLRKSSRPLKPLLGGYAKEEDFLTSAKTHDKGPGRVDHTKSHFSTTFHKQDRRLGFLGGRILRRAARRGESAAEEVRKVKAFPVSVAAH